MERPRNCRDDMREGVLEVCGFWLPYLGNVGFGGRISGAEQHRRAGNCVMVRVESRLMSFQPWTTNHASCPPG